MRRIPIPLESYSHSSLPLSAKRLINLMAEQEPADARTAAALVSTAGLNLFMTVGSGPIWALNDDQPGVTYVVSGTHFYRVTFPNAPDPTPAIEDMGDVGVPARPYDYVTIAVGSTQAVVCVPPNAWTCNWNGPLNQITGDFPGAASVAQLDGYFAFTGYEDDTRWFISYLLDPTKYDALDFAYSDGVPNVIRRVIAHRGEFWLIGERAFEVWYDAGSSGLETAPGTSFFPFRRRAGGVFAPGIFTARSVAVLDGSVWWVGTDSIVYRSVGYRPQRVSTHAIEQIIEETDYAYAFVYNGHSLYCITQDTRTLVYDVATSLWHERSSSADGSAAWRPRTAASFGSSYLLGDATTGALFLPNLGSASDGGVPLIRQATLPPLWATTRRAFCARLEVEMGQGSATSVAPMTLEWSDDGGINWNASRSLPTAPAGQTRFRTATTRLGSFRQRVFRLTMMGSPTLYGVDVDITAGTH
jgi:hypothetical protein